MRHKYFYLIVLSTLRETYIMNLQAKRVARAETKKDRTDKIVHNFNMETDGIDLSENSESEAEPVIDHPKDHSELMQSPSHAPGVSFQKKQPYVIDESSEVSDEEYPEKV